MPTKTKTKTKPKTPSVRVVLSTFDDRYGSDTYRSIRSGKLGSFEHVTFAEYQPRGGTPLLDATAEFIAHLEAEHQAAEDGVVIGLLMDESGSMKDNSAAVIQGVNEFLDGMREVGAVDPEAGGKVLAVIVTDGEENRSKEVSIETLRDMIAEKEATGDWTMIYLGANQDAWAVGRGVGLSGTQSGQTVTTSGSAAGTAAAFRNVTSKASSYLTDNSSYMALASAAPVTNLAEDGTETVVTTGGPVVSYGDVSSALKQAKS